jgi:hypothetical protein
MLGSAWPGGGGHMHFHLPKPLHGWRAFAGEVGIIVLGVLIALFAEELLASLHWRNEARTFRSAVDRELALNLGTFEFNQLQQKCTRRRLDELQTLLERSRNGQTVTLAGKVSAPIALAQYSSVWDNKDAQVVEHLPLDVRLKYAQLYDEFRNTDGIKQAQIAVWKKFVTLEEPGPLNLDDRRQLHAAIESARFLDLAMATNWPSSLKHGADLGIRPEMPPDVAGIVRQIPNSDICKPILKN